MAKTPSKPQSKPGAKPAPKAVPKAPEKKAAAKAEAPKKIVPPITSDKIKKIASKAERAPGSLNDEEIQELGGSVLRHIEPRKGGKP